MAAFLQSLRFLFVAILLFLPIEPTSGRLLMGDFCFVVGSAFLLTAFFACSWLHSQTVRGVGVGFEEPHLRLMV